MIVFAVLSGDPLLTSMHGQSGGFLPKSGGDGSESVVVKMRHLFFTPPDRQFRQGARQPKALRSNQRKPGVSGHRRRAVTAHDKQVVIQWYLQSAA